MGEVALRPEVAEKYKLVKAKASQRFSNAEFGCFCLADLTLAQAERLVATGFKHLATHDKTSTGK